MGPFTLFVGRSAWAYYARPRRPPGVPITAGDLDELAAACATRAVPLEIEWICELHPSFEAVATGAGLEVRTHALMAIEPRAVASGPPGGADLRVGGPAAGVTVRVVGADEPALMAGRAVADVSFGHGGTAVGAPGPAERDAAAAGIRAAFVEHLQARARSGETVTVVAETDRGVVAVGSYQPVGVVAEVVGVATLPSERRRGLGAAVTRALLDHAAAAGITSVLLSAQDEAVERLYRSVGFRRIGTTGAAAAPAP